MKRPLGTAGLVFLASAAVVCLFGVYAAAIVLLVISFCFYLYLRLKQKTTTIDKLVVIIILSFGLISVLVSANEKYKSEKLEKNLTYKTADASVLVTQKLNSNKVIGDLLVFNGISYDDVLVGLYPKEQAVPGDIINCKIKLYDPSEFDSEVSNLLSYNASVVEIYEVLKSQNSFYEFIGKLQNFIKTTITTNVEGERGEIAAAIITGDRALIPTEQKINLGNVGTSHIFVVSGLHVSFLLGFVYSILNRLRLNKVVVFIIMLVSSAFVMLVYSLSVSVVRACVIMLVAVFASTVSKKSDNATSLSFCAIVILLISPRLAVNVSFLLSFGCCFAIFCLNPFLERTIDKNIPEKNGVFKLLKDIAMSLSVSVSITAVTMPIMAMFSIPISLVSPIANVVVVGLMPWLMTSIMGLLITGILFESSFILYAFSVAVDGLILIIINICEFLSHASFAFVSSSPLFFKISVVFAFVVITIVLLVLKNKVRGYVVVISVIIPFAFGFISKTYFTKDDILVTLYYGNSVIISNSEHQNILLLNPNQDSMLYLKSYLSLNGFDNVKDVAVFGENHYAIYSAGNAFPNSEIITLPLEDSAQIKSGFIDYQNQTATVDIFDVEISVYRAKHSLGDIELLIATDKLQYISSPKDEATKVDADLIYDYGENVLFYFKPNGSFKVVTE